MSHLSKWNEAEIAEFENLENEKIFLDEIKNIFFAFFRFLLVKY